MAGCQWRIPRDHDQLVAALRQLPQGGLALWGAAWGRASADRAGFQRVQSVSSSSRLVVAGLHSAGALPTADVHPGQVQRPEAVQPQPSQHSRCQSGMVVALLSST